MMALCQIYRDREAFIVAPLRPFGNFLVCHTEIQFFGIRISLEERRQTALDVIQSKVTIETVLVDAGAGGGGGGGGVVVYEKIHYKDSMPPWGRLGWRYTYTSA